ncbi:MAG: alginate O-acetyltransferase AlgX-related protein [Phenylobacterium sp.]
MLASRLHWRLLVATVLVLMAAAWLTPRWVRPPDIQENRILAPQPAWPRRLSEVEAFREAADPYVADHFPIRPYLIGLLNRVRMLAGVSGSSRVIVGRDGWLFFDDGTHLGASRGDPPILGPEARSWLSFLAGRTETLKARNIPYVVVAAPVKETVYPQFGPAWYPGPSAQRSTLLLSRLAREAGAGDVLYLHPDVAAATRQGQTTFSRHDTHWTGYGAYAGYSGLMNHLHALGLTDGPRPMSDFTLETSHAKNRPRDLALMLGVASFVDIDFPHIDNPSGEAKIRTTYLGPKQDWTAPQVFDTGEVGKPVLLMTRDSFSNEILPLMLSHFSRIVLAHNQDGAWRPDLIDRFKPDIVILEVVEHGLRVSMGDGPAASSQAADRIEHVLAASPALGGVAPPTLAPPTPTIAAIMAGAKITGTCNLEIATFKPGVNGEASFMGSGWISGVSDWRPSPKGFLALKGATLGAIFVGPIQIDKPRPDVANFFKTPRAASSGFVETFAIHKMAAGRYDAMLYRQVSGGWIGCVGKQTVTMP